MARRARHNIEVIIERLTNPPVRASRERPRDDARKPYVPATPDAADHARWLGQNFGPVPLTLLSWVSIVGDVWSVATHPEWPESASADPLVLEVEGSRELSGGVAGMQQFFLKERREWPESFIREEDPEPLRPSPRTGSYAQAQRERGRPIRSCGAGRVRRRTACR
jgi:hypothetical protein